MAGGFARAGSRLGPVAVPWANAYATCVSADRDGDGHIEAKELATVMRIMGMEPTSEQLHSLVESIDVDGNGKIELEEFANMMARQMLLRDGKVRRASSPHLTSPHPRALWRGCTL